MRARFLLVMIWCLGATIARAALQDDFKLAVEPRPEKGEKVPALQLIVTYHGDAEILLNVEAPLAERAGVSKPPGWEFLTDSFDTAAIEHIFEIRPPLRLVRGNKLSDQLKLKDYFRHLAPGDVELTVTVQLMIEGPGPHAQFEIRSPVRLHITPEQANTFNRQAKEQEKADQRQK